MREVEIGKNYKHFKGHIYKVLCIGKNSEDLSLEVVYKNVETDEIWIRNKDDFLSEVDHKKYPEVKQKFRFELMEEGK